MSRRLRSGLNVVRKTLPNGKIREYFYNRITGESLGTDRVVAQTRMGEYLASNGGRQSPAKGSVRMRDYSARLGHAAARTHLIGRGGEALVMYHLARLGIEFVQTASGSDCGDLWAVIDQQRLAIEVKTSRGESWPVPLRQIEMVDFYCFVQLESSACYVMTSAEVRELMIGRSTLKVADLRSGLGMWSKLTQASHPFADSLLAPADRLHADPDGLRERALSESPINLRAA